MACFVKGCKNVKRLLPPGSNISFHRFPKEENEYRRWFSLIGRGNETIGWSKFRYICSEHFRPQDILTSGNLHFLSKAAIPALKLISKETMSNIDTPQQPEMVCDIPSSTSQPTQLLPVPTDMIGTVENRKRKYRESEHNFNSPGPSKKVDSSIDKSRYLDSSGTGSDSSTTRKRKRALILDHSYVIGPSKKVKGRYLDSSGTGSDSSTARKRKRALILDHSYVSSPRKMKVKAEVLKTELQTQRKKLYSAKKSIKLLKLKVNSLKDVVNNLRRQNLMSSHALDHLESSIGDMPKALMARMMKRVRTKSLTKEKYPEELRKFAITLHFYSAKAYEYVRKSFNLSLPHQSTIRKWSSGIESLPGFSSICFEALKQKVDEAKSCNNIVVCSLLIDEMAIKKQIDFDGNRFWGYVDIGGEIEDDQVELAQEAFVVMAVCMNSSWKLPLGYFLIKSLTGAEKANIVQEAIIRLHDIGIDVPSVTCDGPAAHFAMFRELGCDFSNVHNLKTYFNHPVNKETKVYALFDICHMLKLTRNALAMNQILQDSEGGQIKWDYIKKLHEKQDKETLSLANKLKKKHIDWTKQKMKVNLAAQTLSNSVAESLKFLCNDLNLQEFQGCEATVNFIKIVDQAFDIMNSRLPWKMGFKGPLRLSNETKWRPFIEDTINYFLNIKDIGGKYLWETPRKTPVLGFAISLTSILGIFDDYVKSGKMKYILTYKVSQDHLELFFCAARTRNGWNNNPSALQFMRSFKKLILHANIADNGGNCRVLDTTSILSVSSSVVSVKESLINMVDLSNLRRNNQNIQEHLTTINDHDYDSGPGCFSLTAYSENVVTYMAGYVVKMVLKMIHCEDCIDLLIEDEPNTFNYTLMNRRNLGPYHYPSKGLLSICKDTELFIRRLITLNNNHLPSSNSIVLDIVRNVSGKHINNLGRTLFPGHPEHNFNILKQIIWCYCKIRLNNLAQKYTSEYQGDLIRKKFNKLVLFYHQ